ncbi:hypothetical protein D3C81_350410 [compost metagenome]
MKMIKGTVKDFIDLFGQDGVKMANKHKVNVVLAKVGDFPVIEAMGEDISGMVILLNPDTLEIMPQDGKRELTMILYPASIKASTNSLKEGAKETGDALKNKLRRFTNSHLVYHLKRVEQMNKGRFAIHTLQWVEWEGALMSTSSEEFVEYPWEKECYIAQFAHMLGSHSAAQKAYSQMVFNAYQAHNQAKAS